jgi:FADH2 O2-dependent halogenase
MRTELIQIWRREKKTVLFVTHDVEESVQLADRVVVMSRRPAVIRTVIDVNLPRPRNLDSPAYLEIRDEIFETMGLDHSGLDAHRADPKSSVVTGPSHAKTRDTDVIIIGGGPAGAVLGTYLDRAGVDHIIIDKAHHPRPHVGESLDCATMRVLKEIDFLPVMEQERFVVRRGMCWSSWFDTAETSLDFHDLGEMDYSYHVDRAKFDDLLLQHARASGSRVLTGVQVASIDFNRLGAASGVTAKVGEAKLTLKGRLVVDATGRQGLLGRQLKLLKPDPEFRQFAVHSWFAGVDQGKNGTANFTRLHLLPIPRGWAWQIPLSDQVTSIGIVTDREHFLKAGNDIDPYFQWATGLNPILARCLRKAARLREFRLDGNYSYMLERFAGDGWMTIGDAAFFVDPIFSSGVSVAMHSAKLAAETIVLALTANDVSAPALAAYEEKMRAVAGIWQNFVRLFYEVSPIFARVVAESDHRVEVLRLCEGDVYDASAEVTLKQLRQEFDAIRGASDHPLRKHLAALSG